MLQVQSLTHLYHTLDASVRDDVTTAYLGDNEINHGLFLLGISSKRRNSWVLGLRIKTDLKIKNVW